MQAANLLTKHLPKFFKIFSSEVPVVRYAAQRVDSDGAKFSSYHVQKNLLLIRSTLEIYVSRVIVMDTHDSLGDTYRKKSS